MANSIGSMTLSLVGRKFRKTRPLFLPPNVSARSHGPGYAEIWFPSGGCHFDALGECTMCNYGRSQKVSAVAMIEAVRAGLESLAVVPPILWVSAFNVLDDREVSREARVGIFNLLRETAVERVLIETHPSTVTSNKVRELCSIISGKSLGIELGVETMSDFSRKWCINKQLTKETIKKAIDVIEAEGAIPYVNLFIGAPFLTAAEAVREARSSIDELWELGVRHIILFPAHVKEFTVVEQLQRLGHYEQLPLWALVEVLVTVPAEVRSGLYYAWITAVDHPGKPRTKAPEIGSEIQDEVVSLLQGYLASRDAALITRLSSLRTPCRQAFLKKLESDSPLALPERVLAGLEALCGIALPGHFEQHGRELREEITSDWARRVEHTSTPC